MKNTIINGITWRRIYETIGYRGRYVWKARAKNFSFEIILSGSRYYCIAENTKLDIVWNSLWDNLEWVNIDEAIEYCSNWKPQGHTCKGNGVKNEQ